jgi:hypothetical protein
MGFGSSAFPADFFGPQLDMPAPDIMSAMIVERELAPTFRQQSQLDRGQHGIPPDRWDSAIEAGALVALVEAKDRISGEVDCFSEALCQRHYREVAGR